MTDLRRATLSDLPRIIELGIEMHAESPRFSRMRFDETKAADFLAGLITSPDGFVLIALRDAKVIGGMVAVMASEWFSRDKFAYEVCVFVERASRGSTLPVRFMRAYRDWASQMGACFAIAGVSTGVRPDETAAVYRAAGMQPVGQILEFITGD